MTLFVVHHPAGTSEIPDCLEDVRKYASGDLLQFHRVVLPVLLHLSQVHKIRLAF